MNILENQGYLLTYLWSDCVTEVNLNKQWRPKITRSKLVVEAALDYRLLSGVVKMVFFSMDFGAESDQFKR